MAPVMNPLVSTVMDPVISPLMVSLLSSSEDPLQEPPFGSFEDPSGSSLEDPSEGSLQDKSGGNRGSSRGPLFQVEPKTLSKTDISQMCHKSLTSCLRHIIHFPFKGFSVSMFYFEDSKFKTCEKPIVSQ